MSCTALQTELNDLRDRRDEQAELVATLPDNPGREHAEEVLAGLDADIVSTSAALTLCLAQEAQENHPVPQDILGSVDRITCHDASREVGPDEPYLLIAAFDLLGIVNGGVIGFTLPTINVVKVGPWDGVGAGETHQASILSSADRPHFWDLDGAAKPIGHPEDVIFLVACMENDGSSPDAIRGGVRTNLLASRVNNTNRPYDAYVDTMISNMTGAIETLRVEGLGPGGLNRDDLIGEVQQLSLSTGDLDRLNGIEPVEKSLRFTQRTSGGTVQNDYTVFFSFTV
jgi:hypothetical protein